MHTKLLLYRVFFGLLAAGILLFIIDPFLPACSADDVVKNEYYTLVNKRSLDNALKYYIITKRFRGITRNGQLYSAVSPGQLIHIKYSPIFHRVCSGSAYNSSLGETVEGSLLPTDIHLLFDLALGLILVFSIIPFFRTDIASHWQCMQACLGLSVFIFFAYALLFNFF